MSSQSSNTPLPPGWPLFATWNPVAAAAWQYALDASQRNILLLDVLRQRGNQFLERQAQGAPPVLVFPSELLLDGASLPRPVNYFLLRILPGREDTIDPQKRPYVIVDPRAGHGPGIGGSKVDSQIGVALRNGHAVYFVGFRPRPEPGQTLEDIGVAEAAFLREVIARHPEAPKPALIGNCQAGWAVTMLASVAPDLMGALILNGSPLSYWGGKGGNSPLRYSGGIWGGSWVASLLSDLGNGTFDGANLVANFEYLNPANTLWAKLYNVYANIDTEPARFLEFEKWWTGFFLMNREEMEAIVDNLFVGNKLAAGEVMLSGGRKVHLEDITCPIIVFCSQGDNITPPQQALNWILDVYASDEEIIADNQVIVYTMHRDIGHLGIFTSGKVARKETTAIFGTLEFIEKLPPGLYEMIIDEGRAAPADDPGVLSAYEVRFELRSLAELARLDDSREEEAYFNTLAQVSDVTATLYKTFVRPWVQLAVNEPSAELARTMHPLRLQYLIFSDRNPFMAPIAYWAELAQQNRQPAAPDNPFTHLEQNASAQITTSLNSYRDLRDDLTAAYFHWLYGPTAFGAIFPPRERSSDYQSSAEQAFAEQRATLLAHIGEGGFCEAALRIMMALSAVDRDVEEATFERVLRELPVHPRFRQLAPEQLRTMVKQQFLTLYLGREEALATLPTLLPTPGERREAVDLAVRLILGDAKPNTAEQTVIDDLKRRLALS